MSSIKKVLVADDDPDIRRLAVIALRSIGRWQVVVAAGGAEAVALASREQPDLVLMDVSMPGMDGPTALRMLREEPATSSIPVVFITARALPEETAANLAAGAIGVITKPFNPMDLPAELARLVAAARGEGAEAAAVLAPATRERQAIQGEREAYLQSLPARVKDLGDRIAAARRHADREHWEDARRFAHRMRGTAGTLGFAEVGALAGEIEEAILALRGVSERDGGRTIDRALALASARAASDSGTDADRS